MSRDSIVLIFNVFVSDEAVKQQSRSKQLSEETFE